MSKLTATFILSSLMMVMAVASLSVYTAESRASAPTEVTTSNHTVPKIDINQVDLKGLMAIKGIGPRKARAILNYRQHHGMIRSLEQLADIRGFTPRLIRQLAQTLGQEVAL